MLVRQSIGHCGLCATPKFSLRFWRNLSEKKSTIKYDVGGASKKLNESAKTKPYRFYNWWSSPIGQKVSGFAMLGGSVLAAGYQLAPHTVLLSFLTSNYYQHRTHGLPTPVSAEMRELVAELTAELGLTDSECQAVRYFVLNKMDTAGWGDLTEKAAVGYPAYFHFKKASEVPLDRIQLGNRGSAHIKYLSPEERESDKAKELAQGLVLSKEAKKFAITRELIQMKMMPHFWLAFLNSGYVLLTLFCARIINRKLNLFRRPPVFRGINYGTLIPVMYMLYFTSKDGFNRRLQAFVDESTAGISAAYARGGVEYYTQIMRRFAAMRELHLDGHSLYSLEGEEIYEYVRVRNKPFRERKAICAAALEKFTSESENMTDV